ncbi:MAG TPA: T9SS type A sorting domain-containing protein, partial [Chitinophagales bacterium]|nr:T9SS type A sorting domain-containing protein [Chitinophagales bacterium]
VVVTVTQSPVPAITPGGTQNICTGQFVTLDAGAGYSAYLWSNGATTQTISIDSTGTYNVTVTQNGCDGSSGNPPTIFANITPNATLTELGTANGLTLLEASPANATYQWLYQTDPNGPASILPNVSQRDTIDCFDVAQYIRVVVSQGGCADTSDAFTVVCLGINNIATLATFSVQPNPTSDVLNVSYELSEVTPVKISVLDLAGRTVIDLQNENQGKGAHQQNILVGNLADGIYLLNFNTGKGQFNTKFVKQ